jgi:hypothetical protein
MVGALGPRLSRGELEFIKISLVNKSSTRKPLTSLLVWSLVGPFTVSEVHQLDSTNQFFELTADVQPAQGKAIRTDAVPLLSSGGQSCSASKKICCINGFPCFSDFRFRDLTSDIPRHTALELAPWTDHLEASLSPDHFVELCLRPGSGN